MRPVSSGVFDVRDLGLTPYRQAWAIQEEIHAKVATGEASPTILLVEHPPVITFGRRAELAASHLVASADLLAKMGVEVVESDRGGDITFHGPGQVVAYPILRLADFRLSVGGYVRRLQDGIIDAVGRFGVEAGIDPAAIGVWTAAGKLAAVGVRVKQGTTLHGVALNVRTNLSYFNLIVPCGISDRPVTSMDKILAERCPEPTEFGGVLAQCLSRAIEREAPLPSVRQFS